MRLLIQITDKKGIVMTLPTAKSTAQACHPARIIPQEAF